MLFDLLNKTVEKIVSPNRENFGSEETVKYIALLVTVLLWLVILLLVAKYLWNEVLCEMVTFTKEVKSVFQILGLVILLNILVPTRS